MRRLLDRGRANSGFPGLVPSQDQNWRKVPKVNLLSAQRSTSPTISQARVILLVVLLVEAFFIQDWYRERAGLVQEFEGIEARFGVAKRQLAERRQSVDNIRTQLTQLQNSRSSLEQEYQAVTGGHVEWNSVFTALFNTEAPGTKFLSVIANPEGEVVLEGIALAPDVPKTLPTQLTGMSEVLELQSIRWTPGSDPPAYTAVFRVRR